MFSIIFLRYPSIFFFFFFNDTATTEIYTLSLHDALPIYRWKKILHQLPAVRRISLPPKRTSSQRQSPIPRRSEEHTSELQSPCNLVCRLLLEKKKKTIINLKYSLLTILV